MGCVHQVKILEIVKLVSACSWGVGCVPLRSKICENGKNCLCLWLWGVGYVGTLVKMVKMARACCWCVGLVPLPSENCEN